MVCGVDPEAPRCRSCRRLNWGLLLGSQVGATWGCAAGVYPVREAEVEIRRLMLIPGRNWCWRRFLRSTAAGMRYLQYAAYRRQDGSATLLLLPALNPSRAALPRTNSPLATAARPSHLARAALLLILVLQVVVNFTLLVSLLLSQDRRHAKSLFDLPGLLTYTLSAFFRRSGRGILLPACAFMPGTVTELSVAHRGPAGCLTRQGKTRKAVSRASSAAAQDVSTPG